MSELEEVVVHEAAFQRILVDAPSILEHISKSLAERQAALEADIDRSILGIANMATDSHRWIEAAQLALLDASPLAQRSRDPVWSLRSFRTHS